MLLNNTELGKIQDKTVRIFDELINITSDGDISEEERSSKYDKLVEDVVYLVEELVESKLQLKAYVRNQYRKEKSSDAFGKRDERFSISQM